MYVCACILAAGRQGYPPRPGSALPRIRRGRCSHRPGNLAMSQGSPAGVNARPTIHGKREAEPGTVGRRSCAAARQRARCGAGDFARRKPVCRRKLPRRAFTPAGKICAPPGRILARQGAAPLRRLGRHLPLQGRWMRRKAQTEGCIAGLRRRYPARPGRTLPHIRRGRCWHRPGTLALPQGPRRRA